MSRAVPRWLLPTLLVLPFAVVLAADVGRLALARWFPPVRLIDVSRIGFAPLDVVHALDDPTAAATPGLELGVGWLAPRAGGRWTLDDRSRFRVELASTGFRRFLVDCAGRPQGVGARELRVRINGADCGRQPLEPGRQRLAFDLPAGALRPGRNLVELEHPVTTGGVAGAARLALRWHRLAFVEGAGTSFDELDNRPAWEVDEAADVVRVRRSGRLRFELAADGIRSIAWRSAFLGLEPGAGGPLVQVELFRAGEPEPVERLTLDSARRQASTTEIGPVRFAGRARLDLAVSLPGEGLAFELRSPAVGRIY